MGEMLQPVIPGFNRSLRVESRAARLSDPRSKVDVTHDLASLICTSILLSAQGWRDHDDGLRCLSKGVSHGVLSRSKWTVSGVS